MKHITITTGGYVDSLPTEGNSPAAVKSGTRGAVMKNIYSLATQFDWDIRVSGQKWDR